MIKMYKWCEDTFDMEVELRIDTEKFTKEKAIEHLDWFIKRNMEEDPLEHAIKRHATKCLSLAITEGLNKYGVIEEMKYVEGFHPVDGSEGITLENVRGLELDLDDFLFDEDELI